MEFIALHLPKEYANYIIEALNYRIESWERTGRAWEEGEQEVLEELENCNCADDAWVAVRFMQSIRNEIKDQINRVSKEDIG